MGWSIGYDVAWARDIGYGVPAWCDHPDCKAEIDRGLSYVCGDAPHGGDHGCGLYFCELHLGFAYTDDGDDLPDANGNELPRLCERCVQRHEHPEQATDLFDPKPDHPEWLSHKLNDESWAPWRAEYPGQVEAMRQQLAGAS